MMRSPAADRRRPAIFLRRLMVLSALCLVAAIPARSEDDGVVTLTIDQARIYLYIEDKDFAIGRPALLDWVRDSAKIVAAYYNGYPVGEAWIAIRGRRGRGVGGGRALGIDQPVVNVSVGVDVTAEQLADDWVLIHEMIHLAFPSVSRRHHWIEEGLSTYVETIARANAGELTAERVWLEFTGGMPQGLPKPGDRGLDYTRTWGRTYWGGALFCLLADIRIREQTDGAKTLADGLQAVVAVGYDITKKSELLPILVAADAGTGVTAVTEVYEQMRATPWPTELDQLWRDLGVERDGDTIVFDDDAPLAAIREAITAVD